MFCFTELAHSLADDAHHAVRVPHRLNGRLCGGQGGEDAQAAYGFVIQLYFMFIVIANALTVGAVSVVSRLYTSKDKERLTGAIFSSLITTAAAGMLICSWGSCSRPVLIRLLNIPAQLKPFCIPLIRIYSAGLLFGYMLIE